MHWPYYHHHLHLEQYRLHGLWGTYLCHLFRRTADSLVGLFIPIYIYELTGSFHVVFIFYLTFSLAALGFTLPGGKVIRRLGIDKSLALGSILRIGYILLLALSQTHHLILYPAAILLGLLMSFYWIPYRYSIAFLSQKQHDFGKANSYGMMMGRIAQAIGPMIGGILITLWGYYSLYAVAAVFMALSAVVPFLDDYNRVGMHFNKEEIGDTFFKCKIVKYLFAYGLQRFDVYMFLIVWPIVLVTTMGTVFKSGMLQSLSLLVSLGVLFWLSRFIDKKGYVTIKWGAGLSSFQWLLRFLFLNPITFAVAEVINQLGIILIWTPFDSLISAKGAQHYRLEFFIVRQMLHFSTAVVIVLGLWLVYSLVDSIEFLFVIASVVMATAYFLPKVFARTIEEVKS